MTRRQRQWRTAFICAAVAGACVSGVNLAAQNPPAKQSVWDGVYTEAQATRGARQYGRACEQCHGVNMAGDPVEEIPSLVLDSFMTDWNGKTVKELFETMRRSMPKDNPGSLGTGAYVDLVAYLLQANKFPSGAKELSRTPDQLEPIVIERARAQ
jgi:S-disulfanyl-L-cysteine oxidoreductase SoxD